MSNRWITTILRNAEVTGQARAVLVILGFHANDEGHCWPSKVTLARECRTSRTTIYRALDALVASGWVVIEGRNFILRDCPTTVHTVPPGDSVTTVQTVPPRNIEEDPDCPTSQQERPTTPHRSTRRTTNPVVESVGTGTSTGNGQTGQTGSTGQPVTGRPFPVLARKRIEEYGPVTPDVAHRWTQTWEEAVNIADECLPHVSLLAYLSWCREKKRDVAPDGFLRWFINDQQKSREAVTAQREKDDKPRPFWDV